MADEYIDYLECLEYGDFFLHEAQNLSGTTKLVDISELRTYVATAMGAVSAELEKQGVKRSGVRIDRKEVEAKSGALRKDLEKYFHYLASLDDDAAADVHAFFQGGNLGALAALKPADLAQRARAFPRERRDEGSAVFVSGAPGHCCTIGIAMRVPGALSRMIRQKSSVHGHSPILLDGWELRDRMGRP